MEAGYIGDTRAAVLRSSTDSTKWLHQAVIVSAGSWYEALAIMLPGSRADAVWVRVAWYASADGSGSQLSTVDSPAAAGGGSTVATGPVAAPPGTRSGRVRLMLRPSGASTTFMAVDEVRFLPAAPPPASPTSAPAPASTPSASSTPAAAVEASTSPLPTQPQPSVARLDEPPALPAAVLLDAAGPPPAADAAAARSAAAGVPVRITELLPDPLEPGPDADFEWVELTNLGTATISLEGLWLRDNAGLVALPAIALPPGASIVVGGRLVRLEAALVVQLADGISNGLANGGDRLALLTRDGALIDALSYGSDTAYAGSQPSIPAPGPGRSIHRLSADDGSLLAVRVSDELTPGRADEPLPDTSAGADEQSVAGDEARANRTAWIVLTAIAVVALTAAGAPRVRAVLREARRPG